MVENIAEVTAAVDAVPGAATVAAVADATGVAAVATTATAFEWHGAADAPVVALIHGLGLERRMWRDFAAALQADYRVLAYDLFGHGESAPPPAAPSLALFSAQLRGLLDAQGVASCAAVGFSLGGMICRRFAIDHPPRAAALGIFNSPHERSRAAQLEVESRAAGVASGASRDIEATVDAALARWFTPAFRAAQPDYIAQIRAQLLANDPAIYAQCRRVLADGVAELIRPEPPPACPALVMTCENDSGSTPAMSRAIAAELPAAQLRIVPKFQHMGLVESPHKFIAPLRQFLAKSMP